MAKMRGIDGGGEKLDWGDAKSQLEYATDHRTLDALIAGIKHNLAVAIPQPERAQELISAVDSIAAGTRQIGDQFHQLLDWVYLINEALELGSNEFARETVAKVIRLMTERPSAPRAELRVVNDGRSA